MKLFLLCGVVCVTGYAQVSVDESATRARLAGGVTSVSLALENRGHSAAARVRMEWLDVKDVRRGVRELQVTIPPGKSTVEGGMPLLGANDALFFRLRYSVIADAPNLSAFPPAVGTVSFPMIADHAFVLSAMGIGQRPRAGGSYEFRVFASHPITHQPMPGVEVSIDGVASVTDTNGAAALRIQPDPEDWDDSDDVEISGTLGDLHGSTTVRRPAAVPNSTQIYTDKPLYQPGQTAHIRTIVLGRDGRARANRKLQIRVLAEDSTLVRSEEVTTSRFGVASADWEIAPNAEAGKYQVEVKDEDDEGPRRQIEVRAYELPTFRVTAGPVKPFYLVRQIPQVEIRADYLFGKPVVGGKIKITERDDDDAVLQGTLDATGRFRGALKADVDADDLKYSQFRDLHYTAYVTDPSTNRTEQRKFDLRISRDPLHIYVVRQDVSTVGVRIYASVYSPDGEPARSATVELLDGVRVAASGRTNRFGLVRLDAPAGKRERKVRATAPVGMAVEELKESQEPMSVVLETDHSLYRAGQPIRCRIRSDRKDLRGTLLVWSADGRAWDTRMVELREGVAEVEVPYQAGFPRELLLAFRSDLGEKYQVYRAVLYPGPGDLQVAVQPARPTYKPGETASLAMQVLGGTGSPVEADLGIAVVDQAVFERAETDSAGSRRSWFLDDLWRFDTRVGGVGLHDLEELSPEKIDADLDLAAEALLVPQIRRDEDTAFAEDEQLVFADAVKSGLKYVVESLNTAYHTTLRYPTDDASLGQLVFTWSSARDPWDQPYRTRYSLERNHAVLEFLSAGPDKKFDTDDDLVALQVRREWFLPMQETIRAALEKPKDYPATIGEFSRILLQAGITFANLRDSWQTPLRAAVKHTYGQRTLEIKSAGPDRTFGTDDDFIVTTFHGTFFRAMQEKIEAGISRAKDFPADEAEFRAMSGVDWNALRDPWGHPYQIVFRAEVKYEDYKLYLYQDYQGATEQRKTIVPGKNTYREILVRSTGPDGKRGTYDDFTVAAFSKLLPEGAQPTKASSAPPTPVHSGGAIVGVVTDVTGAGIPDVEVMLNDLYVTRSDEEGRYAFFGLPPGSYKVAASSPGFQSYVIDHVPVKPDDTTHANLKLYLGSVSQSVVVTGQSFLAFDPSSAMASIASKSGADTPTATPHVRDYFPETLLWQPELITDASGKASLQFPLADSLTTWHIAVIGSTEDGRIAEGSAEIKAFQPFFADLDPPRVLTVADEISLPVPVRNYTDKTQSVAVEVAAPEALQIVHRPEASLHIPTSGSANAVIGLRAASASDAARLRVTATAGDAADAIEKPMAIHPNGEAASRTVSDLVDASRPLRVAVPQDAMAGTVRGELTVYPSLVAQLLESIEAILRKPWGCAEQTISSSYPNLLVLKTLRTLDMHDDKLEARARRNLNLGYQRLLGYRTSDGGFAYWPNQPANMAVTAYAIQFLRDAAGLMEIDDDVIEHARGWLDKQKASDAATDGLALRALARGGPSYEHRLIDRLGELARQAAQLDDPYPIATFALAAMEAGKPELAKPAIERLRRMTLEEQGTVYWHLKSNTPFYGWGRAGRIEATSLVLSALLQWRKQSATDAELDALIDRATLFLLRNRDANGLWLSTQATIRSFLALLEALRPSEAVTETVEVLVNGASARQFTLAAGRAAMDPVTIDISQFLKAGATNDVVLRTASGRLPVQARFTARWYDPWAGAKTAESLGLQVKYSTAETTINQPVRCDVAVSRPNFRGYGMVIAEVGLPPGAEVDRATLTDLLGKYGVDSFEVAPDRVTFYVWPRAADSKFQFTFRPRYAIKALTAPSAAYDYYNPDERVDLPPASLQVK